MPHSWPNKYWIGYTSKIIISNFSTQRSKYVVEEDGEDVDSNKKNARCAFYS